MNLKKVLLVSLVVIFLILDWFALDDIITGREPNYYGEYAILALSVVVFGMMILVWLKKRNRYVSK